MFYFIINIIYEYLALSCPGVVISLVLIAFIFNLVPIYILIKIQMKSKSIVPVFHTNLFLQGGWFNLFQYAPYEIDIKIFSK